MNYKGYFRGLESNHTYCAKIITDASSNTFREVKMAGEAPFVVTYSTSPTLFEPSRISTATMQIVHDNYVLDVFSPYATGTMITLTDEDTGEIKWKGYLKPNLYDQGYENCYETIQIEASDCLAALQYFTYETNRGQGDDGRYIKGITTMEDIVDRIMVKCGIQKYYIMKGKKIDGNDLSLSALTISEQNFFSSDTDEGWKMSEVIDEIARYLGFTVVQWGDAVYFIDYNAVNKKTYNYFVGRQYNGSTWSAAQQITISGTDQITEDSYRGNGGTISMDTVFNKATVHASTYNIDEFIPDIWDDDLCHNRAGEWNNCTYVPASGKQRYINSKNKEKEEESNDFDTVYVHRLLEHDLYRSRYYKDNGTAVPTQPFAEGLSSTLKEVYNATDPVNTTTVVAHFANTSDVSYRVEMHLKKTVYIYDEDSYYEEQEVDESEETFDIAAGQSKDVQLQAQPYIHPLDVVRGCSYEAYYFVDGGDVRFDVGDNNSTEDKNYIGGSLVDLANYERIPENVYNYEKTSSLSFTRYLCLNQMNYPHNNWYYGYDGTYTVPELMYRESHGNPVPIDYSKHPSVYELKPGIQKPVIFGDGTFIAIDCDALFTRYLGKNYINREWVDEASGWNNGFLGLFTDDGYVGARAVSLIFKLGIGDKYWNGSAWTTTETCFQVPLSTQVDDKYQADLTKVWGKSMHVLNNFSWDEWTGAEGYRIPLDSSIDSSGDIKFEIHVPTKLQIYHNDSDSHKNFIGSISLNGYTWLSKFKVKLVADNEKINEEDIIYENVIDENSINELSDITCKINTYPGQVPLSYSFCGKASGGFLDKIQEEGMTAQKPEENIIEKMVNQYSTPTRKESITVDMSFTPFKRIKDNWWSNNLRLAILGQEIDYGMERQHITAVELK